MVCNRAILGVSHIGEFKDDVIRYIDANHPEFESIMLELPPGWEGMQEYDFITKKKDPFFKPIAEYYQDKGRKIVVGDTAYRDILKPLEAHIDGNQNTKELLRYFYTFTGFLDGRVIKNRNEAMQKVFQEEQPDITLVGGMHAKYLKKQNQEIHFVSLKPAHQSLGEKIASLYIDMNADEIIPLDGAGQKKVNREYFRMAQSLLGWSSHLGG